jgi:hypothetical protein
MGKSMTRLQSSSRKFVASLLLCLLTIVSTTATICPSCANAGHFSEEQIGFSSLDHQVAHRTAIGMAAPAVAFNLWLRI